MSSHYIQKKFPRVLHTPAKYEKNLPYDCEAIAKRKCGSGESSGVSNPYPYGCRDLAGQYIIGQGQIKAGFQISTHPPVRDRNAFGLKRLRP